MGNLPSFSGSAIPLYLLAAVGLVLILGYIFRALGLRARVTTGTPT